MKQNGQCTRPYAIRPTSDWIYKIRGLAAVGGAAGLLYVCPGVCRAVVLFPRKMILYSPINTLMHGKTGSRRRLILHSFPDRIFDLLDFHDAEKMPGDYTDAFQQAITACHDAGGGMVRVPAGDFPTGPIRLRSNVNLHLMAQARIAFIPEPKRYLPAVPSRWEGVELMNYHPPIYAYEESNIAVTGEGTFDGRR